MDDKQALSMVTRCTQEIESLHKEIKYLRPQAEAYDAIRQILGMTSRGNSSMGSTDSSDVLWLLRQEKSKLEHDIKLSNDTSELTNIMKRMDPIAASVKVVRTDADLG